MKIQFGIVAYLALSVTVYAFRKKSSISENEIRQGNLKDIFPLREATNESEHKVFIDGSLTQQSTWSHTRESIPDPSNLYRSLNRTDSFTEQDFAKHKHKSSVPNIKKSSALTVEIELAATTYVEEPNGGEISVGGSVASAAMSAAANYILAFVAAWVLWIWLKTWLFGVGSEREMKKLDEVFAAEGELWKNRQKSFEEDVQKIRTIMESNFKIAEKNFETKQRDFIKWLPRITKFMRAQTDPKVLESFRRLVSAWLSMFGEAALNPAEKPNRPVTEDEVKKCVNPQQVSELVLPKVKSFKLDLIGKEFTQVQEMSKFLATQVSETVAPQDIAHVLELGCCLGCGIRAHGNPMTMLEMTFVCARVKFSACEHVFLVLSPFIALGFACFQFSINNFIGVGVAMVTTLFCFIVLCTVDVDQSREMLEADVKRLQEKNAAAKEMAKFVMDLQKRLGMLENLWLHRTIAAMDILKCMHDGLEDQGEEDVPDYLENTTTQLDLIEKALGPITIWFGKNALEEAKLQSIGAQLHGGSDQGGAFVVYSGGDAAMTLEGPKSQRRSILTDKEVLQKLNSWPDKEDVTNCHDCDQPFGIMRKQLRCKKCGQIFCATCAPGKMPLPEQGTTEPQRVCKGCHGRVGDAEALQCTGCKSQFGVFLHRHHCKRCEKTFCSYCTSKTALIPKKHTTKPARVCDPCYDTLDQESRQDEKIRKGLKRLPTFIREVEPVGFLTVRILSASELPNMQGDVLEQAGMFEQGQGALAQMTGGANISDPYVRLSINDRFRFHTTTQWNTMTPEWNEEFFFPLQESDRLLTVEVRDDAGDTQEHGLMGKIEMKIHDWDPGVLHIFERNLHNGDVGDHGKISLQIHFAEDAWQLENKTRKMTRVQTHGEESAFTGSGAKLPQNCDWSYADLGMGGIGILNPLRWSGQVTIANAIKGLERADDKAILVKIPAGASITPKRFESKQDAIEHLLTLLPKKKGGGKKLKLPGSAESRQRHSTASSSSSRAPFKRETRMETSQDLKSFLAD